MIRYLRFATVKARSMGWAVLFVSVSIAAIGAVWLQPSADGPVPFYAERPPGFPPDPDIYMYGLRPDQEIPIGTPEVLPFTTTRLSPAEFETASAIAFADQGMSDKLADHRYQIVEAEKCEQKNLTDQEGVCWRIGIFDYDAGVCTHVFINALSKSIEQVLEGGCSTSNREFADARAIAESDPLVREALDAFDDEKFIRGKTWFPRLAQEGHRYVEVRWSVDGGTAGAEFVVDLTTRTVCHECR